MEIWLRVDSSVIHSGHKVAPAQEPTDGRAAERGASRLYKPGGLPSAHGWENGGAGC